MTRTRHGGSIHRARGWAIGPGVSLTVTQNYAGVLASVERLGDFRTPVRFRNAVVILHTAGDVAARNNLEAT